MQSSPFSLSLTILHWILFLEAIYCVGIVGLAYGLGEGLSAALDIVIRVLSFKEGVKTAILLYIYPIFVTGLSLAKQRLILFPWSP
jgi:hypothetical protein